MPYRQGEVDRSGGWMSGDGGPSRELEAIWGPGGRASTPNTGQSEPHHEAAEQWTAPVLLPAERVGSGRRLRLAAAALVAVSAIAGGGVFVAARDSDGTEIVNAAASDTPQVSDELRDSANEFLERWNAGPSTTMPLGEAGVPLSERPTTTTSTSTTTANAFATTPRTQSRTPGQTQTDTETETSTVRPRPTTTTMAPTLAADDPRLRGAEERAQQFVDAMMRRDCEAVWSMLSSRTIQFFEEMGGEEEGESMKDSFCASLREEEIPAITVVPPARPYGKDGALVTLEAEGEPDTEDLPMLLESATWTVDLVGDYYDES